MTGGGARLKATGRDRPRQSNAFGPERDSGDPPGSLAKIIADHGVQGAEVERPRHAQRSWQRATAFCLGEAGGIAVQVGAAAREAPPVIGHGDTVLGDHAQQLRRGRASAAADAGAFWPGGVGHDSGRGIRNGNRWFG